MAEAAKFRTGNLELPDLGGLEPYRNTSSRHGVLLEAKMRQKKAVDHILGHQDDLDRFADRNMQFIVSLDVVVRVKLPIRSGVDKFPVELFADSVHDEIGRRALQFNLGPDVGTANVNE